MNVAAAVIIVFIKSSTDFKDEFYPGVALASAILIWGALFILTFWQVVGVWRSATNYRYVHHKKFWGACAKVFIVIGMLRLLGDFGNSGLPQINELYNIFAGDQELGKYSFACYGMERNLSYPAA